MDTILLYLAAPFGVIVSLIFLVLLCFRVPDFIAALSRPFGILAAFSALFIAYMLASSGSEMYRETKTLFYTEFFLFTVCLYNFKKILDPAPTNLNDLTNKIAIVTGANSGIGFEASLGLARLGATVILACRDERKGKEAALVINTITDSKRAVFLPLDLASLKSVVAFSDEIKKRFRNVDIIVNNGGFTPDKFEKTEDGIERSFGVMHLAHFLLVKKLLPIMNKNGRIVTVASFAHVFIGSDDNLYVNIKNEDVPFDSKYYPRAKFCNLVFAMELNNRLKNDPRNITSYSLHPGTVATPLLADVWPTKRIKPQVLRFVIERIISYFSTVLFRTSVEGASDIIFCAAGKSAEQYAGQYIHNARPAVIRTKLSQDTQESRKLWTFSEELVKPFA